MATKATDKKGVKVLYIGHAKRINCSLGQFRVKTNDNGERFIRVPTKEIADKFVAMFPKEFRGHTGTAILKRKGPLGGVRSEGLDKGEVEDDGLDEEEKLLGEVMTNPRKLAHDPNDPSSPI